MSTKNIEKSFKTPKNRKNIKKRHLFDKVATFKADACGYIMKA